MSLGYNPLNIFQFRCARTAASLPAASLANIITGNVAYISNTTAALPVAAALGQFGQAHGGQTTVRSTCSPTLRMIPASAGRGTGSKLSSATRKSCAKSRACRLGARCLRFLQILIQQGANL